MIRYISLQQQLTEAFGNIPFADYMSKMKEIQQLLTVKMTYMLDKRLIDFYEGNRATAKTLREIIRKKQKFPREQFEKLKAAFPCILSGIRDYAEYIPLEQDLFDLVIIDEASQVSVAQAFPALLRAKKVLIFGDKKQFSNVKTAQARSDTNKEYVNRVEEVFKTHISMEPGKLVRLAKFNIKTSILEFFEYISNYHASLLKHFRGYKELISYSNRYFYKDQLQVMKIRGKAISEVLRFSYVTPSNKTELAPNTNLAEVDFILSALRDLKNVGSTLSVGVITPHTNQQKLLFHSLSELVEADYFFNKMNLKVMTFDTCQGEERDMIFYSMVASPDDDKLVHIFISDLSKVDIEEEGLLKAQRLNVGLSRCKECMHFVLSKQVDQFTGSIGQALRHYQNVLSEAVQEHSVTETDSKSPMEPQVLNWFYQTGFWRTRKEQIEIRPQFELGKYLKQLDKTYSHPLYKVDFLLTVREGPNRNHNIILEYDGFQEHFGGAEGVDATNYSKYYSDYDQYREKVLESYGYRFLKINKFNVGANPIATLDSRLNDVLRNAKREVSSLLREIGETIGGLANGDVKECAKCHKLKGLIDFRDEKLKRKYGILCKDCKSVEGQRPQANHGTSSPSRNCPKCGYVMVLRNGRRGKFYGCRRYPKCRGTRDYR